MYKQNFMEEEIIKLEEELRFAMLASDVAKLDELIADSLMFIAPNGMIVTKQMDIEAHKSGLQKMTKLSPSEQQIKVYDNCAIVTVKMEIEGTYGDTSISGNYRYIRTWSQTNGALKVVAGSVVSIIS